MRTSLVHINKVNNVRKRNNEVFPHSGEKTNCSSPKCAKIENNSPHKVNQHLYDKENLPESVTRTHSIIRTITGTIKRSVKLIKYLVKDSIGDIFPEAPQETLNESKYRPIPLSALKNDESNYENMMNMEYNRRRLWSPSVSHFFDDNLCLKMDIYKDNIPQLESLKQYLKKKKSLLRRSTACPLPKHALSSSSYISKILLLIEEDPLISLFLKRDVCRLYADKYLLAMVIVYFVRTNLSPGEFNRYYFFAALYLAHDMEEDNEEAKYEFLPFSFGSQWKKTYPFLLSLRDDLFWAMDCRAVVSRKSCEQVIEMCPSHWLWARERPFYHGYTILSNFCSSRSFRPRGPFRSPLWCRSCLERECSESDNSYLIYSSASDISSSPCSQGDKTECNDNYNRKDSGYESFLQDPNPSTEDGKDVSVFIRPQ